MGFSLTGLWAGRWWTAPWLVSTWPARAGLQTVCSWGSGVLHVSFQSSGWRTSSPWNVLFSGKMAGAQEQGRNSAQNGHTVTSPVFHGSVQVTRPSPKSVGQGGAGWQRGEGFLLGKEWTLPHRASTIRCWMTVSFLVWFWDVVLAQFLMLVLTPVLSDAQQPLGNSFSASTGQTQLL